QVGQILPAPKLIGMFLSRGRRRHERDERVREGAPSVAEGAEEPALAVPAGEDGELADAGVAAASGGGVPPSATPGQEGHVGSRRRRRRAWERRRERLRALHEQATTQEAPDETDVGPPLLSSTEDGAPGEPVERARRPRRRRVRPEDAPVETAPSSPNGA